MEMKQPYNSDSIHALLTNTQAKKLAAPSAQSTEHLNNMMFSMSKTNSLILSTGFQSIPAISMAEIPKSFGLRRIEMSYNHDRCETAGCRHLDYIHICWGAFSAAQVNYLIDTGH